MESIGERLRKERFRKGLDLNQIAELTKINLPMLEAIEADDLEGIPGNFFLRSFVRQYAKALGLDAGEFEAELQRVAGAEESLEGLRAYHNLDVPATRRALRSVQRSRILRTVGALAALVMIVTACSALYHVWQRSRSVATAPPRAVAKRQPPPAAQHPIVTARAVPPSKTPAPAAPARPVVKPAPPAPAAVETAAVTAPPKKPAPTVPKPEEYAPQPAERPADVRVELRATAEAWVRVTSGEKHLYSGVLQPNEVRFFEGHGTLTVKAGNAAALTVTYNGKPMGELGPEGEVRTVEFTPSGFRFVAPAPQPPPPKEQAQQALNPGP
jgi:cytoskeleton protein RodZ